MISEANFYSELLDGARLQKAEGRVSIYAQNILQARKRALLDLFPAVTACLSDSYIHHVSEDFCAQYAPKDGNLNLYGAEFGAYLSVLPACQKYEYIRDLADFEYKISELSLMADQISLSPEAFSLALSKGESPRLSDAVCGFITMYPVADILDYSLGKTTILPEMRKKYHYYFLYRDCDDLMVYIKRLKRSQFECIPALKTCGTVSLTSDDLRHKDIVDFVNFLIAKKLWIS